MLSTENSPRLIVIQATPFCNIDCSYCYLPDRQISKRIQIETVRRIFATLISEEMLAEEVSVAWHAGEPLVLPTSFYRQVFQTITQVNSQGIRITHSFQTNGTLINQEWCDLIREYHVEIGVSIDGPQHIHDRTRVDRSGKGTFDRTVKGIRLLQKNAIDVHVIMVLTDYALDFAEEIFEFFVDIGIRDIAFNIEELEGINLQSSVASENAVKRYAEFLKSLLELRKHLDVPMRIREIDDRIGAILFSAGNSRCETSIPFSILSFDCDGNYSTFSPELLTMSHERFGNFVFGNIYSNSPAAMAADAKYRIVHDEIEAGILKCRDTCEFYSVCGGGAPVNKLCENGTFASTSTYYCQLQFMTTTRVVLDHLENQHGVT